MPVSKQEHMRTMKTFTYIGLAILILASLAGAQGMKMKSRYSGPAYAGAPMLKVTAAKPLDGYRLEIEFNDGIVRVVDCSFLLHGTLGEPLKNLDYFRQVRVDDDARTIVWPNGLDPAPELLHGGEEAIVALGRQRPAA